MSQDGADRGQGNNGAEPVYGPAYHASGEPRSARQQDRRAGFDGPSPPYTAPYPPYPSDVPERIPLSLSTASAMAYLVVPAVFFLLLPPYRAQPALRFHSWQAVFYFIGAVAAREVEQFVASMVPSALALLLGGLLLLALFAGWMVAVVKALQGERWHLPLVGAFAEQVASTSSLRP